jgi:hypothetical protein
VGGEHSRKEPSEQLVNSYSQHLHLSARPVQNAPTILMSKTNTKFICLARKNNCPKVLIKVL